MPDVERIVVVVPAHDEAENLPRCLRALITAAVCVPVPVSVVVVLDNCADGSHSLAGRYGPDVHFVEVDATNVGAARAAGFRFGQSLCTGTDPARIWLATTDADSTVPADWLLKMTRSGADMVVGEVRVAEWRHFPPEVAYLHEREYAEKGKQRNHIHGANMGFRADVYWALGGFRALETGEDVELAKRFDKAGLRVAPDRTLSVATSDRPDSRAPAGFAADLGALGRSLPAAKVSEPA
ncbi:glycosyltransferase [Mycobacterium sp. 48b]|uniref:glycosyltransferase n=1 Tax=Mycobacterium sp. 48b TaxID=3400426 RepID=UPI003AAC08B3